MGTEGKKLAFELVSDLNPQRPIIVMRWWERGGCINVRIECED